jgi:hypothetical protein
MTPGMRKALDLHAEKAERFLSTAESVPVTQWNEPRSAGKWSPAEIAAHLVTTYEVVIAELRGGKGMAIKTSFWQQMLFRLMFGWRILYFGKFPPGIKAPRETRPPAPLPKENALERFRSLRDDFEAAAQAAPPGHKLSHAYFGRAAASHGVLLCARHIEHHRQQLVT